VQLVYEAEQRELDHHDLLEEQVVEPDDYTRDLVEGVGREQVAIDDLLRRFATDWPLERMAALDRAVLRIGVYELCHRPEVPTGVVLNEAVELANAYATDDSGRFVNGVLAAIAREVRTA